MSGQWILVQEPGFPFDLLIVDGDREVIRMRRVAHSTGQNTIDDCMDAVGFRPHERDQVGEMMRRQLKEARLIAAAPELLEAAENALAYLGGQLDPSASEAYEALSAAIAKATGEQP